MESDIYFEFWSEIGDFFFMKEPSHAIRYYGGKTRGLDKIIPFFPANMKRYIYVEPFCGGLNVAFTVNSRQVILNDINEDLQNFWWVIRGYATDMERYTPYKDYIKYPLYDMLKIELKSAILDITYVRKLREEITKETDPDRVRVLRALCYYLKNRWVFSGIMAVGDLSAFYNVPGRVPLAEEFDHWHKWFVGKHARIWGLDFRDCIRRVNKMKGEDRQIFMYLDPPYVRGGDAYQDKMSEQDHRDLAELLRNSKHQWVLSYDNHPLIKELYKDFVCVETDWTYTCRIEDPERKNKELIITNIDYGGYE